MACHEVAALRLGLMKVLGLQDEAERQHELSELGDAVSKPGAISSMTKAADLESLRRFYQASLSDLQAKVAKMKADDPKLAYHRSLLILTKKVELDLDNQIDSMKRLFKDLDEVHDFVHEVYPR